MITNYGIENFIVIFLLGVISLAGAFWLRHLWFLSILLGLLGIFLIFIAIWFFRDPERITPQEALQDNSIIISPADGHIMEIVDDFEPDYFKDSTKRISIFLSPLDVHVNRVPMNGIVEHFKFVKGKKLIASKEEASAENQQSHFGVSNDKGKILFKQIVGILARRLVWDIKIGDKVKVGQRFGMMKFGSRMDIHLPRNSSIKIKVGDKVTAGISFLAKLN
ncbi:MAG: phosphatidylserine decarboxylase [Ignavibacteria bacterium GWF2_33_9]|nr:MAG: phosphatidylserine decarboxylase [Ignavibacteria bacterium GWF2_33_9]